MNSEVVPEPNNGRTTETGSSRRMVVADWCEQLRRLKRRGRRDVGGFLHGALGRSRGDRNGGERSDLRWNFEVGGWIDGGWWEGLWWDEVRWDEGGERE